MGLLDQGECHMNCFMHPQLYPVPICLANKNSLLWPRRWKLISIPFRQSSSTSILDISSWTALDIYNRFVIEISVTICIYRRSCSWNIKSLNFQCLIQTLDQVKDVNLKVSEAFHQDSTVEGKEIEDLVILSVSVTILSVWYGQSVQWNWLCTLKQYPVPCNPNERWGK